MRASRESMMSAREESAAAITDVQVCTSFPPGPTDFPAKLPEGSHIGACSHFMVPGLQRNQTIGLCPTGSRTPWQEPGLTTTAAPRVQALVGFSQQNYSVAGIKMFN